MAVVDVVVVAADAVDVDYRRYLAVLVAVAAAVDVAVAVYYFPRDDQFAVVVDAVNVVVVVIMAVPHQDQNHQLPMTGHLMVVVVA